MCGTLEELFFADYGLLTHQGPNGPDDVVRIQWNRLPMFAGYGGEESRMLHGPEKDDHEMFDWNILADLAGDNSLGDGLGNELPRPQDEGVDLFGGLLWKCFGELIREDEPRHATVPSYGLDPRYEELRESLQWREGFIRKSRSHQLDYPIAHGT